VVVGGEEEKEEGRFPINNNVNTIDQKHHLISALAQLLARPSIGGCCV